MTSRRRETVFDLVLAGGFLVAAQVELALDHDLGNPRWWDATALALLMGALAWRRRTPVLVCAATVVLVAALTLHGDIDALNVPMVVLFVPPFAVARYAEGKAALLGLALALVAPVVVSVQSFQVSGLVFDVAMVAASWAAGRALRVVARRAQALRNRSTRARDGRAELERLATASERARIARDLQTVVVRSVSDMVVQAETAARLVGTSEMEADACMQSVEQAAQWVLEDMRRMLGLLRSRDELPGLSPLPGLESLDGLAGVAVGRTQVQVVGAPRDLPTSVSLALFRVVEAADDEVSAGTTLEVTVRYLPEDVEVDIATAGGVPRSWPTPHMREWARLCESDARRRTTSTGEVLTFTAHESAGVYA